jgi:hypothetical protein
MMQDIDYASRLAEISQRLALHKKLSREERERIETTISNACGNGDIAGDEYRKLTRAVRAHE